MASKIFCCCVDWLSYESQCRYNMIALYDSPWRHKWRPHEPKIGGFINNHLGLERWNWMCWNLQSHYICKGDNIFISLVTCVGLNTRKVSHTLQSWLVNKETKLFILSVYNPMLHSHWLQSGSNNMLEKYTHVFLLRISI